MTRDCSGCYLLRWLGGALLLALLVLGLAAGYLRKVGLLQ